MATALVVNVSNARCDLHGAPSIQLVDAGGSSITPSAAGVLPGDNVPLHTGEVALATVIWSNWCSPPPSLPLGLRLGLSQEGGTLTASIGTPGANDEDNLPRCDVPTAASSASALPFRAAEPTLGGGQIEACRADQLTAFVGEWGAAAGTNVTTLVVLNLGSVLVQDCRLPTSPIAELRDAAGHALAQSEAAADAGSIDLPGTGAAWTNLGFANWCADPPAEPLSIDLVVGLDEVLVAAIAPVPVAGCSGDPGSPAFFGHLNPLALP